MRFLRMLTNASIAGALGAAYLTILVLQLNPQVPLLSPTTWHWYRTFAIVYGLHLAVLFYVLMVVREVLSLEPLSPGWASVRVLAWLVAATAAGAALLMWLNVQAFEPALLEPSVRRMTAGAIATASCAAVLLGIAVAHYSFGRRGSGVGAALFVIAVFGSLALPIAARGPAVPSTRTSLASGTPIPADQPDAESAPRVIMLLLDGGSLEYIWPRAAEGRLPNFARILENGAAMDLATIRPTAPDPVWAAVATGMYPARSGVRSAGSYYAGSDRRGVDLLPDYCFSHILVHFGFVRHEPNAADAWRSRPLWRILSDAGISVGVVRWPMTYPVTPVRGFMVSNRLHEISGSMRELDHDAVFPADALDIAQEGFAESGPAPPANLRRASLGSTRETSPADSSAERDGVYSRIMRELRERSDARFLAVRYQSLDTAGHYFAGYTQDGAFDDMAEDDRRQYVQLLDRHYAWIDREVGAAIQSLAPGDLLLIVSGFGIERVGLAKQALAWLIGEPGVTGTHERAPDGFLLAYGTAVEPGRPQRASVVDVAPTVLYYLGLPIGRDMDGYARTDLFRRSFTAERPIGFIPSYDDQF